MLFICIDCHRYCPTGALAAISRVQSYGGRSVAATCGATYLQTGLRRPAAIFQPGSPAAVSYYPAPAAAAGRRPQGRPLILTAPGGPSGGPAHSRWLASEWRKAANGARRHHRGPARLDGPGD